jgi:hypothetical protein
LTEIVVVFIPVYIVATVAVVRILIGISVPVVGAPAVLTVSLSGSEALLIAIVHGLAEDIGAVLIDFIVAAAATVAPTRGGVEIRVMVVIVVAIVPETYFLLPYPL